MKHRTFLTTLLLFLLTVHLGIALIAIHTYRETLDQARMRSASAHYFIASGLLKDMAALDSRNTSSQQGISQLAVSYGNLAENQNASIALYEAEELLYSNLHGDDLSSIPVFPEDGDRRILTVGQGMDPAIFVIGRFPEPYGSYALVYRSSISDTLLGWESMKNTMFGIGLILSGILAICLLLLLNRLFLPLTAISKTSRRIAGGEYSTRLAVKGKDELAEMAESFNHMADEIERQIEELVNTAESKQLFIDNFAHELKTPLTAVYGYAEYLQKASVPEDDRNFALECILSESKRIQTMAYQMMELANLRGEPIHSQDLSVKELLEQVQRVMAPKATSQEIDLQFSCTLETLHGDASLLESLLINFIDNGLKASEAGGSIIVKAYREMDMSVITVEDHGKGMPPESLPHITEPYYRVEKHRHRRDGGAGLGLAICNQIAKRHQAKISFSSSPGNGTTVKVTFYNSITT